MLLDPVPNLIHYFFCHMTSYGVGGRCGLLSAFDRHKGVAKAGIQEKLHVVAPTQGILPDLEILSRDLVVAAAEQKEHRLRECLRHMLRVIGVQIEPVGRGTPKGKSDALAIGKRLGSLTSSTWCLNAASCCCRTTGSDILNEST